MPKPVPAAGDPLRRLATRQDGLVTRRQALDLGMTPGALRHRIASGGRWGTVIPGVYATFTGPLTRRHLLRAALLHAGPAALLSGATAAALHDLRYAPDPGSSVHVLIPHEQRTASTRFVRIRRTRRMPEGWRVGGLLVVPVADAVVEAVRLSRSLREVRAALCEPVQRGWCSPSDLATVLESGARQGRGLARRALADVVVGCRSAPECELRDLVRSSRVLPEPRWNLPLPGAGAHLVPDACWPEARLVVEVDSTEWHRFGDAPEATERRRARLASLGWRVLPVSPRRLRAEPVGVRAELEAAYRAGRLVA